MYSVAYVFNRFKSDQGSCSTCIRIKDVQKGIKIVQRPKVHGTFELHTSQ